MKVRALINQLRKFEPEVDVLVASDEELNTLYERFVVSSELSNGVTRVVIYGIAGFEFEKNGLSKVLANRITQTITEEKITHCPKCDSKVCKTENTYGGISYLSVVYCENCNWQPTGRG